MARFTNAAFVRSHGSQPRGRGTWAFQCTTSDTAFSSELHGDVVFVDGTLTEAKRLVAAQLPADALVAVLP